MDLTDTMFVEAYRAADVIEAHAIQIALQDAGIRAEIDGESLQGSEYPLGWSTAPRILVAQFDVESACKIIAKAHARRRPADGEACSNELSCLSCGQLMDRSDTCPVCGWSYQAKDLA